MAAVTPAELLDGHVVLTPHQVAVVLGLTVTRGPRRGEPDVRRARHLIRTGALAVVDAAQPPTRWTVSTAEVRRYIAAGPRRHPSLDRPLLGVVS